MGSLTSDLEPNSSNKQNNFIYFNLNILVIYVELQLETVLTNCIISQFRTIFNHVFYSNYDELLLFLDG